MPVGKKNKLRKAIEECNNNDIIINSKYSEHSEHSEHFDTLNYKNQEMLLDKTVAELHEALIDFVNKEAYPLCEYLSLQNIKNFVSHVIS